MKTTQDAAPASDAMELDPGVRAKLAALCEEGHEIWDRFDIEVRQQAWHPFVAANYEVVQRSLVPLRGSGLRFLEWGSASGVITIMADLLGFEAYGIEIDAALVDTARALARRFGSRARFAVGSFLPAGYQYRSPSGDHRLGTIGRAPSGYIELGHPLEDFDVVFAYPWSGEEGVMHDVMRQYGSAEARLLMHGAHGVEEYREGRRVR